MTGRLGPAVAQDPDRAPTADRRIDVGGRQGRRHRDVIATPRPRRRLRRRRVRSLRPVSAKNTSSSEEWRTPTSSTSTPSSSRRRTACGTSASHLVHGDHHAATSVLDVRVAARERRQALRSRGMRRPAWDGRPRRSARRRPAASARPGVPRSITTPWSITAMSCARRSASSRYCVVSRVVMPAGDQLVDEVPHRVAAAGVEPGGRLVEEQHRRPPDEAHGDVEATAHAARVGAGAAVGGAGEVEALEQLAGALGGRRCGPGGRADRRARGSRSR